MNVDEYPFTGFLTPTGLAPETNGLRGGVVPGEQGEGFPLFYEPSSASSAMSRFGQQVTDGYLCIGPFGTEENPGLDSAKEGDVLDVPAKGVSGVVMAVKIFAGFGDFDTCEVLLQSRSYGTVA